MKYAKASFLCLLSLLPSCGPQPKTSQFSDVTNPGGLTQANDLIWAEGARLFLGQCPAGKEPLPTHCTATHSGSVLQLKQAVMLDIEGEKQPWAQQLMDEIQRLRREHPRTREVEALRTELLGKIQIQNDKIAAVQEERHEVQGLVETWQQRLQEKTRALEAVDAQIALSGMTSDLQALRQRLQQEYEEVKENWQAASTELLSLDSRLSSLNSGLTQLQTRLDEKTQDRDHLLATLDVSSELGDALQAKISRLEAQLAEWPTLISLIQQKGIVYRSLDFTSVRQQLLDRLIKRLKERSMLPFREDFAGTLDDGYWSLYSSSPAFASQIRDGQLLMEAADGGINEAILKLPLAGLSDLMLQFDQTDLNDNETLLPNVFQGHSTGDGVSISRDGQTWYTIVNAFELNTTEKKTYTISLDEKMNDIRRDYDAKFALDSSLWIKFQQYEAATLSDARAWDNISVIVRKARSDRIRLSPTGILEVSQQGQWRDVCDDGFDAHDAQVACWMLGGKYQSFTASQPGSSSFWLDDLACKGTETSLFDCQHSGVGQHNCGSGESVRLVCVD